MESIYNLEALQGKIRGEKGLLVYFSSESCSVCKVLKPKVISMLRERFPNLATFYVDTEKSPLISGQHLVYTIPTILLFFNGKEHLRLSRNIGLHQLEEAIRKPYNMMLEARGGDQSQGIG